MLGMLVVGAVALGAVVLETVSVGAVVVTSLAGAVVVGADVGGEVAAVPGVRGVGAADCPTTTPTEVLPPRDGALPSRLASGRPVVASTVVTAPIATANTAAAASATRCQRSGRAGGVPASASPPALRGSVRRSHRWVAAREWAYPAVATAMKMLITAAPARVPKTPKNEATTAPLMAASAPPSRLVTRSSSIPHLGVGDGGGGGATSASWARPDGGPATASGISTLATKRPRAPVPRAPGATRHPEATAVQLPVFA